MQMLPWLISDQFSIESLSFVGEQAGMLLSFLKIYLKLYQNYFLDQIFLTFKSNEDIKFGFYFGQFLPWFTQQLDLEWPSGNLNFVYKEVIL